MNDQDLHIDGDASSPPGPIEQLGHELKIRDAMDREFVRVEPETRMSELRPLLRENRIAGIPVMDGEILEGVISVEDMVNWMASDAGDCPVRDCMTSPARTLCADEPLVHAVRGLRERGYFHFPVVDRKHGNVVGVITREGVITRLLCQLEVEYHEEEIRHYRASHIFDDIVADKCALVFHYYLAGQDFEDAGACSSGLKKTLRRLGVHPDIVRRTAIATYEAEINSVIYANAGEVTVKVDTNQIRIRVEDQGPGIEDIAKALEPGYSTAPDWVRELGFGAGMGLHNIQKCSDEMNLTSTVGQGVCLEIIIAINKERVSYETRKAC